MSKHACTIDDLFDLFEESLSPADVITSKLMAQVSTAITKERLKLSMNQSDFAEHIGTTQSLVSRWEHGDYNFSIRKIAEIAAVLNLDVNISMHSLSFYNTIKDYEYTAPYFSPTNTMVFCPKKSTKSVTSTYASEADVKSIQSKEGEIYASVH